MALGKTKDGGGKVCLAILKEQEGQNNGAKSKFSGCDRVAASMIKTTGTTRFGITRLGRTETSRLVATRFGSTKTTGLWIANTIRLWSAETSKLGTTRLNH